MKYAWVVIDNDMDTEYSIVSICEAYMDAFISALHHVRYKCEDNSDILNIDFTTPKEGVKHVVIDTKDDCYHFTIILKEIQVSV